jgi:6-phosphofructokinase 1
VAEGAGEELLGASSISAETDAGGNKKLAPIGEFIKQQIEDYFTRLGEEATVKYIDPSYTVRSVPANAADSLYCMQLAQNAVHGAMAGLTGFSVGLVNNHAVYLPIPQLVSTSPRSMDPYGTTWESILAMTGQPNTAAPRVNTIMEVADLPSLPEPTLH